MTKNVDQNPLEGDKFSSEDPSDTKSIPRMPDQTKLGDRARTTWHRTVVYASKLLLDACRIQAC